MNTSGLNSVSIPTLVTERLALRPLSLSDGDALYEIFAEKNVTDYFPNPNPPDRAKIDRIIESQLHHWQEHDCGWWAVEDLTDKALMGWCGLQYLPDTDEMEVAYMLGKAFWGQGYATEAALASLNYGIQKMKFKMIVGIVHPKNRASQNVLEKIGMQFTLETVYFGMPCYRYAYTVKPEVD